MYKLILVLSHFQLDDWITRRLHRLKKYDWLDVDCPRIDQIREGESFIELQDRIHNEIMDEITNLAKINKNKFYRHVFTITQTIMIDDVYLTVHAVRSGNGVRIPQVESHFIPIRVYDAGFIYLVHTQYRTKYADTYEDAVHYGITHCNGRMFFIYLIRTDHVGGPDFDFVQNRFSEEDQYNKECRERIQNLTNPEDIHKVIMEYAAYEFQRINPDGTFNSGYRSNVVSVTQHDFKDPEFIKDLKNARCPVSMDVD